MDRENRDFVRAERSHVREHTPLLETAATMRLTIDLKPGLPMSPTRVTATTPRGVEAPSGWHLPTDFDANDDVLCRKNATLLAELCQLRVQVA